MILEQPHTRRENEKSKSHVQAFGGNPHKDTHELISLIGVHELIQHVQQLDPKEHYVLLLRRIVHLEVHEGLAQQRAHAESRLWHTSGIEMEDSRIQQIARKREQNAIKDSLDLRFIQVRLWSEEQTLEINECSVSYFSGGIRYMRRR